MRVTYITAGAADMICGSCLRDNALVRKLREQGCEVTLVPVYTPITVEEDDSNMGADTRPRGVVFLMKCLFL